MAQSVNVGDQVRFLNSVGGGKVVKIQGSIAYVEDEDGFEVPVQLRECVVVDPARSMGFTERPTIGPSKEKAQSKPSKEKEAPKVEKAQDVQSVIAAIETPDGDVMNVVLGFEASNMKALSQSGFEGYLVNDSNYRLSVAIMTRPADGRVWTCRYAGVVDPNIEEHVMTLENHELAEVDRMAVQLIAYKEGKSFELKRPVNLDLKVDATKFLKLHCYRGNRYFESPVIAFELVKDDHAAEQAEMPSAQQIATAMTAKAVKADFSKEVKGAGGDRSERRPMAQKKKDEPIVVDLHAAELFDDMRGLSSADILNRQIDRFAEVMDAHKHEVGRKLIFIHGKGEGVLRQALMKELTHRYKGHDVQDASFQEYGYGATQVTIRPMAAAKNGGGRR